MTRKEIVCALLVWALVPAWILTFGREPRQTGKPFRLSSAAEKQIAEYRDRASGWDDRALKALEKNDLAEFQRDGDESEKLTQAADGIEDAEFEAYLAASGIVVPEEKKAK